jgi:hypothetical protein
MSNKYFGFLIPVSFFALIIFSGCVTAPVHNDPKLSNIPSLYDKARAMKKIDVIIPYVSIYEVNTGGVSEERDDWEAEAYSRITEKIRETFKKRGIETVFIRITDQNKEDFRDVSALAREVTDAVTDHTYYKNDLYFAENAKHFEYSVGSVGSILKKYPADGVLFFSADASILSAGRQAVGLMVSIPVGHTFLRGLVCDEGGTVLWSNYRHFWGLERNFMKEFDSDMFAALAFDSRGVKWEK